MTIDKNPEFMNLSWQDRAICKNKSDLFFGSYNERTTAKIKREQEQVRGLCACMCGSKDAEGRGKGDDGRTKTNQRNLQ